MNNKWLATGNWQLKLDKTEKLVLFSSILYSNRGLFYFVFKHVPIYKYIQIELVTYFIK